MSDLSRIIGEAIGEASLQWDPKPTGVFDSGGASALVDRTVRLLEEREAQAAAMREALELWYLTAHKLAELPTEDARVLWATTAERVRALISPDAGKALLERLRDAEHWRDEWKRRAQGPDATPVVARIEAMTKEDSAKMREYFERDTELMQQLTEAKAVLREVDERGGNYEDGSCIICCHVPGHAPDCRLAKVLK